MQVHFNKERPVSLQRHVLATHKSSRWSLRLVYGHAASLTTDCFQPVIEHWDPKSMEFTPWHHPGCTWPTFSNPTDACSEPRHDSRAVFGSGNEQPIGLSTPLLNLDSLCAIEGSNHTEEYFTPRHDLVREGSVPVEQLMGEILWPQNQQDGSQQEEERQQTSQQTLQLVTRDDHGSRNPQHDRTTERSVISQPSIGSGNGKRKRGRPRLFPTTTDADNSDIFPNITLDSRKFQLEKNRLAAEKCRQRRKESTATLVADVEVLSSRNEELRAQESALREELLDLKNKILSHAGCNSSLIDEYITRSASSEPSRGVALKHTLPRRDSGQETAEEPGPDQPNNIPGRIDADREPQTLSGLVVPDLHVSTDAYDYLELLEDFVDTDGK